MKQVYLVGNAHIDPVWLWRKGEGMAEVLSTFRSALDRMNEFDTYVFTCACAYYYEYVSEVDPDMMREIRERVSQGRWVIAGGMWVQTDMNLPGAEAFARHMLYSQRTFRRLTGRMARTGYCVDSFGHNGMTPQLLRGGRMSSYVFMRPGPHENAALCDLFTWRSPDGSEVLTYRIPFSYGDGIYGLEDRPERGSMSLTCLKATALCERAEQSGCPQMAFFGVGNHGGGPTIAELNSALPFIAEHAGTGFGDVDEYFADVRARGVHTPVWEHDLQHHASGCYTANVRIKSLNRRAETALTEAETLSAMASALANAPDVRARVEAAWKKVMFNQFHDVLAGCTLRSAAGDACRAFCAAIDEAEDMTMYAMQRWARRICTRPEWGEACLPPQKHGWLLWQAESPRLLGDLPEGVGAPAIAFNAHSFPLDMCVALPIEAGHVRDAMGNVLPVQSVRGEQTNGRDRNVSLVRMNVSALGYATCYIYAEPAKAEPPRDGVRVQELADAIILENEHLRVEFDRSSGLIRALTELEGGRSIACGAAQGVFIDDSECDTWAHGVFSFEKEAGAFRARSVELIDRGPLRASVRVVSELGRSVLSQLFTLDAGGCTLACRVKLMLNDELRLCRLMFPTGMNKARAITSMPGGFIEKAMDGREQPGHKWAALCGGHAGLAVLNDGRYGVSFKDGAIRLAIARSAFFADHFGQRDALMECMDMGETEFNYALMPCRADELHAVDAAAEALCAPPRLLLEGQHGGELPAVYEGARVSLPNVRIMALKRAECGQGWIVRIVETAGRACNVRVELPAIGADFSSELAPMQIATYRIADGRAELTDFVEPDM